MASIKAATQFVVTKARIKFPHVREAVLTEMRPPTPMEFIRGVRDGIQLFRKPNWQNITVRDAWRNTLVTTEVICWFFVGECIGKCSLIGYQV